MGLGTEHRLAGCADGPSGGVEHDPAWHAQVKADLEARGLSEKVDYRLIPAEGGQMDEPRDHPYAAVGGEIEDGSLDFAVIDGQMRLRCVEKAVDKLKPGGLLALDGANRYLPNRLGESFSTIQHTRAAPPNDECRAFQSRIADWRALHTSHGLWDTRFWVRPGKEGPRQ